MKKRLLLWIGSPVLFVAILFCLRHYAPRWTDLSYDSYDGRVIVQSFEQKVAEIFRTKPAPKGAMFVTIPNPVSPSAVGAQQPVFSLISYRYIHKIESPLQRIRSTKAEFEIKALYLTKSNLGQYESNVWYGESLIGRRLNEGGVGVSDVRQDASFNGETVANQIGQLKRNSHVKVNDVF